MHVDVRRERHECYGTVAKCSSNDKTLKKDDRKGRKTGKIISLTY